MTATASRPRAVGSARSLRDTAARIARGLATPVIPEDYLDLFAPLRSGADLRGRIVAITPETRDAATITIRPGRDCRATRRASTSASASTSTACATGAPTR